jgi:general secretion pathway protein C
VNTDQALKRIWPLIVCGLLAAATYFQGLTIATMTAGVVSQASVEAPRLRRYRLPRAAPPSAAPILARNAFDSVTGPLDGSAPEPPPPATNDDENAAAEPGDPTAEPKCDFGRVVIIMASDDPVWSFASVQSNGEPKPKNVRIDQVVGEHRLVELAWNRAHFEKDGKRCQMKMGDKSAAPAPKAAPAPRRRRRRRRKSPVLPESLRNKITKISDTEYKIERSVVDEVLEKQAQLMRYTRLRPIKSGDKVTGLRVSRVRPGTLLDALGVKNGDELRTINGFELTNPQRALEAYGRLRTANSLSLQVMREGKPVNIDFKLQ